MTLRLYGPSARGPSMAALGPRVRDVGRAPLTRAERAAAMRASAGRYKQAAAKQAAAGYVAPTLAQTMQGAAATARQNRQKYEADRAAAAKRRKRIPWYKQASRAIKKHAGTALKAAATGASFVPGVGTAVASTLGTAAALASGASWSKAALAGAVAALPGGAATQAAARAGLAIAQGKRVDRAVLASAKNLASQTIRSAIPRGVPVDTRAPYPLRSADPLRSGRLGPIGRPTGFGAVGPRLARMAIERTPVLATRSPEQLGAALGISPRSAASALSSARALRWRPLRGKAPAFVAALASGFPSRFLSRRDASGLSPDGATWTIEKGDTLSAISRKLTGDANRWREFIAANPGVKRHPSWGLEVYAGDVIAIPAAWRPESTPPPSQVTSAQVLASKAILKAWSVTDGQDQAGLTDYGTRPEDLSASWGPRDRLMLASFSRWRGNLPVDGDLTQAHAEALAAWAEARAGVPAPSLPLPSVPAPQPPQAGPAPVPSLPTPSLPALPPAPSAGVPAPIPSLPAPTPPPQNRQPLPESPRLADLPTPPPPPRPTTASSKSGGAGVFGVALAMAALLL